MPQREQDFALLGSLLDDGTVELRGNERDAFEDMRERLQEGRQLELTRDQRKWAVDVAERLGVDQRSPAERNAEVPRGREVQAPPVLSQESLRKALERRRGVSYGR